MVAALLVHAEHIVELLHPSGPHDTCSEGWQGAQSTSRRPGMLCYVLFHISRGGEGPPGTSAGEEGK